MNATSTTCNLRCLTYVKSYACEGMYAYAYVQLPSDLTLSWAIIYMYCMYRNNYAKEKCSYTYTNEQTKQQKKSEESKWEKSTDIIIENK